MRATPRTRFGLYLAASVGRMVVGRMVIATANGILRERVYGTRLAERTAHAVSLLPMAGGSPRNAWALERRWPLPSAHSALGVGAVWSAVAVGFEVGLGRVVARRSWSQLLCEYDPGRGRPGAAVLAVSFLVPSAVRAVR